METSETQIDSICGKFILDCFEKTNKIEDYFSVLDLHDLLKIWCRDNYDNKCKCPTHKDLRFFLEKNSIDYDKKKDRLFGYELKLESKHFNSDNDSSLRRPLYSEPIDIEPQFKSIILCNQPPLIDPYINISDDDDLIVDSDMSFKPPTIEPDMLALQDKVAAFVTDVIILSEKTFYQLSDTLEKQNLSTKEAILCHTQKAITKMISLTIETFYNNFYKMIQTEITDGKSSCFTEVTQIKDMAKLGGYGPHILLDKLFRLTIDMHYEIIRENLDVTSQEVYVKTVLNQINVYLMSSNLLHWMSKGPDDDIPFYICPDGSVPFKSDAELIKRSDVPDMQFVPNEMDI